MTKVELFRKAHQLAKTFTGDYRARFSLALIELTGIVKAGHIYTEGESMKVITEKKLLSKREVVEIIEIVNSQVTDEVEDRLYNENPANYKQAIVDFKLGLVFQLAPNSKTGYGEYRLMFENGLNLKGYDSQVFRFFNR